MTNTPFRSLAERGVHTGVPVHFVPAASAGAMAGAGSPLEKSHERHMTMQQMRASSVMAYNGQRGLFGSEV